MKIFINETNKKLSKAVFLYCDDLSYSAFQKALRNKDVKVNGKRINKDLLLNEGDRVEIYYSPKTEMCFEEIFRDENVLVINKKQGVSSENTFDAVKNTYKDAGFIHRLDRNTKGVMIFSLNERAEKELLLGFKNRTFYKEYTAEVVGIPKVEKAVLEGYLLKDDKASIVKISDKPFKGAVYIKTGYEVVEKRENSAILKVILYTGKTHQIRAHLAFIGHPIVGDGKYGLEKTNKLFKKDRQQLCASKLILKFDKQDFLYYLNNREFNV